MMIYAFPTKVVKVFRHQPIIRSYKVVDEVHNITEDCGWFVRLEGSYESLFLGMEEPELKAGDRIKVTLEKVS